MNTIRKKGEMREWTYSQLIVRVLYLDIIDKDDNGGDEDHHNMSKSDR